MIEYKSISKNGQNYFLIKCKKSIGISNRENMIINEDGLSGFIPFSVSKGFSKLSLCYHIFDIPISEFFCNAVISKNLFFMILSNIIKPLKNALRAKLVFDKVIWNVEMATISLDTLEVNFIYVPVNSYKYTESLKDFLISLINIITFDESEDLTYVNSFISLLNSNEVINVLLLEKYIFEQDKEKVKTVYDPVGVCCPTCNTKINADEEFCPACGRKMKNFNSNFLQKPLKVKDDFDSSKPTYNIESTGVVSMFYNKSENSEKVYLYSKNQTVPINCSPFKIGKSEDNNLILKGQAVSRKHAELVTVDNKYFIVDLDSTNGTYVNGRRIESHIKVPLLKNAQLSFATENYIFNY